MNDDHNKLIGAFNSLHQSLPPCQFSRCLDVIWFFFKIKIKWVLHSLIGVIFEKMLSGQLWALTVFSLDNFMPNHSTTVFPYHTSTLWCILVTFRDRLISFQKLFWRPLDLFCHSTKHHKMKSDKYLLQFRMHFKLLMQQLQENWYNDFWLLGDVYPLDYLLWHPITQNGIQWTWIKMKIQNITIKKS